MTQIISIPRTLANRLLTLAQLTPDTEVCGLISNNTEDKYQVYPVNNIANNAHSIFEMDPQQQINAFKLIREKQQTLFAIYHSHPDSDATPSAKDLHDAAYKDTLNIIISLSTEGVLDMRAYFYQQDKIEAVDLIIE
ncbi:MAG: hypothetical protein DIZ80_15280 [endosymbiont of Galathealinum brachiosum]|uniref:MPN domain-containing protein n=1 Tax=endosymbiont of Galathealinum brachiosum TaxID=2200906 RepID=A0A370D974_9GAMM|nr:MAG: hypothetical protein DIZ80_15280 [endosymbiont of Galathealinum brachiosum]